MITFRKFSLNKNENKGCVIMKNFRVLISLLVVAFLSVWFVSGCTLDEEDGNYPVTGNVEGTVTDSNNNPISGATCTITTNKMKAIYKDITDENGLFLITGITAGTWPLSISKTGYQTLSLSVIVNSGTTSEVPSEDTVIAPVGGFGTVAGTVSSAGSAIAIEGATVAIGTLSTTTSSTGEYNISGVAAGTQSITAGKSGYNSYSSTVEVVADTTVIKDIAMTSGTLKYWTVNTNTSTNIMEISYGDETSSPQYAALHKNSGYFRLIPTTDSGWGTSVVIVPSFWEETLSADVGKTPVYHQGTPITVTYKTQGDDLLFNYSGTIYGLSFIGTILLNPPANDAITATVDVTTTGDINLADKPDEAFKPVMLSSMHESSTIWDCSEAFIGSNTYPIPTSGWIVSPAVSNTQFGLKGGTCEWKTNAPTIEININQAMPATGWVTESTDPNDDNVGFWAASDQVLRSWSYTITSKKP